MSRRITNKQLLLMLLLAALLALSAGGTVAFLIDTTDEINNTFKPVTVSCEVEETFVNNTKRNVAIKNTSDIDAYIRAEVVITWQNENGEVYGQMPVKDSDYIINYTEYNTEPEWVEGADGFFYWTAPVAPKEAADNSTGDLIESVEPKANNAPEGYSLCVEILGSAVQADGGSEIGEPAEWTPAVVQAWDNEKINIRVDKDRQLSVENQ